MRLITLLSSALVITFGLAGCLRVREHIVIRSDLSGDAELTIRVPRGLVPNPAGGPPFRVQPNDIHLPQGVHLIEHDVAWDDRDLVWMMRLSFASLEQLGQVKLRVPGSSSSLRWGPWQHMTVEPKNHYFDVHRPPPVTLQTNPLPGSYGQLLGKSLWMRSRWELHARSDAHIVDASVNEPWYRLTETALERRADLASWVRDRDDWAIRLLRPMTLVDRMGWIAKSHTFEVALSFFALLLAILAIRRRAPVTAVRRDRLLPS